MSFVDQIRQIKVSGSGVLSAIEQSGDAEAIAISFSNFSSDKEVSKIGAPRASTLYDACMRKHVIGTVLSLTEVSWGNLRQKLIYGFGNAMHREYQNTGVLFGDNRYGWWLCLACGKVRYFGSPPKRGCEFCGAKKEATVYKEHPITIDTPLIVRGHNDLFVKPAYSDLLRVAELKTLYGDEFDTLVAPLVGHEWQLQTYMWGCSIDKTLPVKIDSSVGYVAYISKRPRQTLFPLKIFPVHENKQMQKRIKEKLSLYKGGIEDYPNNLPPLAEECSRAKFESYRSKQCVAMKECARYVT